jgi:hypothetical protein
VNAITNEHVTVIVKTTTSIIAYTAFSLRFLKWVLPVRPLRDLCVTIDLPVFQASVF